MQKFIALLTISLSALAQKNVAPFMEYCSQHQKSYKTMEEFSMRLEMWNKVEDAI